jgi:uncharacterized protein
MSRPVTEVLVKPSGRDCNLACAYCFYSGAEHLLPGAKTRMSDEVLEAMISQLLAQPVKELSVGWQGGEPTLMGIPFFHKALRLMQHYGRGKTVANGLQTNGILVDKHWAKLFADFHFLIGLSIDGPEHVHDHYRRDLGGKGSWRKAANSAKRLLDAGVEVNALTVVNEYSAKFPQEIYSSLKSLGLNFMQFIPCVETHPHNSQMAASFSLSGEMYGNFLCTLFDLWIDDFSNGVPTTSIRFFESLLFRYAGLPPTECTQSNECGSYLVVEHAGEVYACDFFVEPEWRLGNLRETPIVSMMNSVRQKEFGRLKAALHRDCLICEWKELCRGGCTKDRLRCTVDGNLNHLCSGFKMFFPHADVQLRRLADDWKKKQDYVNSPNLRFSGDSVSMQN